MTLAPVKHVSMTEQGWQEPGPSDAIPVARIVLRKKVIEAAEDCQSQKPESATTKPAPTSTPYATQHNRGFVKLSYFSPGQHASKRSPRSVNSAEIASAGPKPASQSSRRPQSAVGGRKHDNAGFQPFPGSKLQMRPKSAAPGTPGSRSSITATSLRSSGKPRAAGLIRFTHPIPVSTLHVEDEANADYVEHPSAGRFFRVGDPPSRHGPFPCRPGTASTAPDRTSSRPDRRGFRSDSLRMELELSEQLSRVEDSPITERIQVVRVVFDEVIRKEARLQALLTKIKAEYETALYVFPSVAKEDIHEELRRLHEECVGSSNLARTLEEENGDLWASNQRLQADQVMLNRLLKKRELELQELQSHARSNLSRPHDAHNSSSAELRPLTQSFAASEASTSAVACRDVGCQTQTWTAEEEVKELKKRNGALENAVHQLSSQLELSIARERALVTDLHKNFPLYKPPDEGLNPAELNSSVSSARHSDLDVTSRPFAAGGPTRAPPLRPVTVPPLRLTLVDTRVQSGPPTTDVGPSGLSTATVSLAGTALLH